MSSHLEQEHKSFGNLLRSEKKEDIINSLYKNDLYYYINSRKKMNGSKGEANSPQRDRKGNKFIRNLTLIILKFAYH